MDDNPVDTLINKIIDSLQLLTGDYLLPGAGAICIVIIIWGGIQYITGGAKGAETGKKTIIAALVGLIIVLVSRAIIDFVANGWF